MRLILLTDRLQLTLHNQDGDQRCHKGDAKTDQQIEAKAKWEPVDMAIQIIWGRARKRSLDFMAVF